MKLKAAAIYSAKYLQIKVLQAADYLRSDSNSELLLLSIHIRANLFFCVETCGDILSANIRSASSRDSA